MINVALSPFMNVVGIVGGIIISIIALSGCLYTAWVLIKYFIDVARDKDDLGGSLPWL